MSTVQRSVYLSPVEPSPLSLRVASGIETWLAVRFYTLGGDNATFDLLAQLELTGRSGGAKQFYSMPSTDVVNGQATAFIPAGDLADPNGYRLNLYGTVEGQPQLLANGIVAVIAAAGPQAVPLDTIDQIDLVLTRGRVAQVGIKLWEDAAGSDPFELADEATTVTSRIYKSHGGAALVPFAVTVVASNEVLLTLTSAQVDALPDLCWWSLVATYAGGANTLCEGSVTVKNQPAPPAVSGDFMISLYYLATAGQTVFPVTTPDRFGNIGSFAAATIPHVSRSGVRISPMDGFTTVGDTITLTNPAGEDEPITIDIWEAANA